MQHSTHETMTSLFPTVIFQLSESEDNKGVFYPPQFCSDRLMWWVIAEYIFHSLPPELHSHQTCSLLSYGVLNLERIHLE